MIKFQSFEYIFHWIHLQTKKQVFITILNKCSYIVLNRWITSTTFNILILDVGEVNYMFLDTNCLLYVFFFLNSKDIFVLMVKIVLLSFFNHKNLLQRIYLNHLLTRTFDIYFICTQTRNSSLVAPIPIWLVVEKFQECWLFDFKNIYCILNLLL